MVIIVCCWLKFVGIMWCFWWWFLMILVVRVCFFLSWKSWRVVWWSGLMFWDLLLICLWMNVMLFMRWEFVCFLDRLSIWSWSLWFGCCLSVFFVWCWKWCLSVVRVGRLCWWSCWYCLIWMNMSRIFLFWCWIGLVVWCGVSCGFDDGFVMILLCWLIWMKRCCLVIRWCFCVLKRLVVSWVLMWSKLFGGIICVCWNMMVCLFGRLWLLIIIFIDLFVRWKLRGWW